MKTVICSLFLLLFPLLFLAAAAVPEKDAALPMIEVHPKATDAVLLNPGMGLYLQAGTRLSEVPPDAWYLPVADIAYFRMNWSDVQPREDEASLRAYFDPIFDYWVKKLGKRVAFRVMSMNVSSNARYVTPEWVFQKGVPSVVHTNGQGIEQIDPVFWDDRYLTEVEKFIALLGRVLDGRPGLEFVDIGCIGEWGEMHLGQHIPGRWSSAQLAQVGFTDERHIAAYRRIIDAHARAFPHTRVFLNVGDYDTIVDYAALRGINFRQDGLNPSGPSSNVGKRFYQPYARRGVICNYEFFDSYQNMLKKNWDLHTTIEKGLEDPISYLNTNLFGLGELAKAPEVARQEIISAGRRLGFRFELQKLSTLPCIHVDGKLPARLFFEHTWKNTSVAPCYESYSLRFSLLDARGKTVCEMLHFPRVPTTQWWPGESVSMRTLMQIPPEVPVGRYRLAVSMLLPEAPDRPLTLPLEGRDTQGRYPLVELTAEPRTSQQALVYQEGFEGAKNDWQASPGIQVQNDAGSVHAGGKGLHVTGTQKGDWSYAMIDLPGNILPASRYRLTAWLRVQRLENGKPPFLKIGLTDADKKWITNINTSAYDMSK
ncbi:MAG TPA: carbohydrate binding domain-containing protein, partial [Armatimonadota bacterium]|nr:carbohydrate binding domain-containing protein [Armatimonadota bacterium]